jgi:hypothetical protein
VARGADMIGEISMLGLMSMFATFQYIHFTQAEELRKKEKEEQREQRLLDLEQLLESHVKANTVRIQDLGETVQQHIDGNEAHLAAVVAQLTQRAEAPGPIPPTGTFGSWASTWAYAL